MVKNYVCFNAKIIPQKYPSKCYLCKFGISSVINLHMHYKVIISTRFLYPAVVLHKNNFSGVNKNFQLFCIYDKFTNSGNRDVKSQVLWDHLATMYNLEALDLEQGGPNFPNDEREFYLDGDYDDLKESKQEEMVKQEEKKTVVSKGRETPKKEIVKKEREPGRGSKERRDSNSSKDSGRSSTNSKKETRREAEKTRAAGKTRTSTSSPAVRDEAKGAKGKVEETPRSAKRPTRGSLKPDDLSSNGKASPVTVNTPPPKRRRI